MSIEKFREKRNKAMEFLRLRYPKTFPVEGEIVLLEIGLDKKLLEDVKGHLPEGITLKTIKKTLWYYCNSYKYRNARHKLGKPRISLEGEEAGENTEEHVERNKKERAEKRRLKAEKKAKEEALKPPEPVKEKPKKLKKKKPSPKKRLSQDKRPQKTKVVVKAKVKPTVVKEKIQPR